MKNTNTGDLPNISETPTGISVKTTMAEVLNLLRNGIETGELPATYPYDPTQKELKRILTTYKRPFTWLRWLAPKWCDYADTYTGTVTFDLGPDNTFTTRELEW